SKTDRSVPLTENISAPDPNPCKNVDRIFFGSSSVLYHWIKQCSIPFIGLHAQGSSAQFGAHDRMTLIASFTWVMGSTAPLRDQLRRSIDRSSRSIARGTVIAPADRILRALAGGLASIDLRADLL